MATLSTTAPVPFELRIPQSELEDLKLRLGHTRAATSSHPGWEHGTNREWLRELLAHWQGRYDFRAHEAELNELPQFKVTLDGTQLHFAQLTARAPRALPLLLLHGWPDSFYRFHAVMPQLARPESVAGEPRPAFDVVAPSLPGFAFSGPLPLVPTTEPTRHSADLLWRLMTEVLGYERFMIAAGDAGGMIAQVLAIDHPEAVLGLHLSDLGSHVYETQPGPLTREERKFLEAAKKHRQKDGASTLVQQTRPRSIAPALNDSPAALASWIADRFHAGCDTSSGVIGKITGDQLLTNITLYWLTQSIGSAMFYDYAAAQSPSLTLHDRVERPVALALFPKDMGGILPPRSFAERTLNVTRFTELPRGGHFAPLEEPELFVSDLADFARSLSQAPEKSKPRVSHAARTL